MYNTELGVPQPILVWRKLSLFSLTAKPSPALVKTADSSKVSLDLCYKRFFQIPLKLYKLSYHIISSIVRYCSKGHISHGACGYGVSKVVEAYMTSVMAGIKIFFALILSEKGSDL